MKLLFAINHPAQYHLFKNSYLELNKNGHDVVFVIKDKDILEELLISEKLKFIRLTKKRVGKKRFSIIAKGIVDLIIQDINLYRFVKKFKPDLMVGTDYSITHIGKIFKIPSIVFNEDDFVINKFFCRLAYPLSSCIVSPSICNVGKYFKKKISYNGYQKLSYLHPRVFQPDPEIVKRYLNLEKRYFLIRLVSFSAGHDIEMKHGGINKFDLNELINILNQYGNVFITSESKIPTDLEQYKLKIDYKDIHHLLAFASLIIADSQSMIVEAAMLGTPSIRFNSFVGKISVLEELENDFALTIGIHNSRPDLLIEKVKDMLEIENMKDIFIERKNKMLAEKINVNAFITWFIENYPESEKIMRKNPDYQYNFK